MPVDPVGGREAEREAVARAMCEQGMGFDIDEDPVARESMFTVAEVILAALDAVRSSGSAAQNQEEPFPLYIDHWLCPTCGGKFCRGAGEEPPHARPRVSIRYYRPSGSAAQNQEDPCSRCHGDGGWYDAHGGWEQCSCERFPQSEDHEDKLHEC